MQDVKDNSNQFLVKTLIWAPLKVSLVTTIKLKNKPLVFRSFYTVHRTDAYTRSSIISQVPSTSPGVQVMGSGTKVIPVRLPIKVVQTLGVGTVKPVSVQVGAAVNA